MKTCVIDASVVAAAFFQEEHAGAARTLLAGKHQLHAPDLIHAEVANNGYGSDIVGARSTGTRPLRSWPMS